MNIFRSEKMTKTLPLLTARFSILCTRRLQPPRDDCAVRVQWFSSVSVRPGKLKVIILITLINSGGTDSPAHKSSFTV